MTGDKNHARVVRELRGIFAKHKDKRISVIGASCIGKTTLMRDLVGCIDHDQFIWESLPRDVFEKQKSFPEPWGREALDIWIHWAAKIPVRIERGRPLFSAGVFKAGADDCDLMVHLCLSDAEFLERVAKRGKTAQTMLKHKSDVDRFVAQSKAPVIAVDIGRGGCDRG